MSNMSQHLVPMFINKLEPTQVKSPKMMSNVIQTFLRTELTCVPKVLTGIAGEYYNNALCNGATWVFFIWCLLHVAFDKCFDAFLKRLKFKCYLRARLKQGLWYMGFFATSVIYCGATLAQNEIELFNFKQMRVPTSSNLPMPVVLGYTLIVTFYLHSAFYEAISNRSLNGFLKYFFLSLVCLFSYLLRVVEITFTLTSLIGINQVLLGLVRVLHTMSTETSCSSKILVGAAFFVNLAAYVSLHIIVIPLTFIVPLGLKIMSDYPDPLLLLLFLSLLFWLTFEVYRSVFFKCVDHWLYHEKDTDQFKCPQSFLECSLFPAREDDSYHIGVLKRGIKFREEKMLAMRRPKNRSMLLQTLKCVVAIKRKLKEKNSSEGSDSDDSENSENVSENENEETYSDDEEDSDELDDEEIETEERVVKTPKVLSESIVNPTGENKDNDDDDDDNVGKGCEGEEIENEKCLPSSNEEESDLVSDSDSNKQEIDENELSFKVLKPEENI